MSLNTIISIVFGLCLILVVLIGLQWRHLRGQIQERKLKNDSRLHETQAHLVEGLNTLLLCLIQGQVEIGEAVLRIKVHLDHLFPLEQQRTAWIVFYQCAQELEGFATHKARLNLKVQERLNQDLQRQQIEDKYLSQLMSVAKAHYPLVISQK
jgi:hypothetical protein